MIKLLDGSEHHFDRPFTPNIETIAHALAFTNRWSGHTREPYSVAQHCVMVSYMVPTLEALLHDATEAYLGDVAKPLKQLLPEYQHIETEHWHCIAEYYGLPRVMTPEVKYADYEALAIEDHFLRGGTHDWGIKPRYAYWCHVPTYHDAKLAFLKRYEELR